jgi:hypothetical protein
VQYLEPLVHPAPSGTWNTYGATPFARADWTGVRPEPTVSDVRQMVRRYLAAFGTATVVDARAWSGVAGLLEVFAELRTELRVYADESGRELFDVPAGVRPPADQPPPPRPSPGVAHSELHRLMLGHESYRERVFSRPEFLHYRMALNYTYLHLTRLGLVPMERFRAGHLLANAVEAGYGVSAVDLVRGIVAPAP